jgi:hypothetical protein
LAVLAIGQQDRMPQRVFARLEELACESQPFPDRGPATRAHAGQRILGGLPGAFIGHRQGAAFRVHRYYSSGLLSAGWSCRGSPELCLLVVPSGACLVLAAPS